MVWVILVVAAFGVWLYWWLVSQLGVLGALLGLLLIPVMLGVAVAIRDRLDRRRHSGMRDASAQFDANRPNLVSYNDASGLGNWPTAYGDQPSSDSTPPGVSVEERDLAP